MSHEPLLSQPVHHGSPRTWDSRVMAMDMANHRAEMNGSFRCRVGDTVVRACEGFIIGCRVGDTVVRACEGFIIARY